MADIQDIRRILRVSYCLPLCRTSQNPFKNFDGAIRNPSWTVHQSVQQAYTIFIQGETVIVTLFAALTLLALIVSLRTTSVLLVTVGAVKYTVAAELPVRLTLGPEVCVHA